MSAPQSVSRSHPQGKVSRHGPSTREFREARRAAQRQARAAAKRERRVERGNAEDDGPVVDEEALMARYGELSQQREANEIDEATFEQERIAIFVELGLVPAGRAEHHRGDGSGGPSATPVRMIRRTGRALHPGGASSQPHRVAQQA